MRKKNCPIIFIGTIQGLCFYRSRGQYLVRTSSSLTGKRVKKDPAFRRTMEYAGLMGRASKIGSVIYKALPEDFRQFWMYRAFTGEAMKMLKEGMLEEKVTALLWKTYVDVEIRRSVRISNKEQGILNTEVIQERETRTWEGRKAEYRNRNRNRNTPHPVSVPVSVPVFLSGYNKLPFHIKNTFSCHDHAILLLLYPQMTAAG